MTLKEFKIKASKRKFNNCNGWGFGGTYGTLYSLAGFLFSDGRYSTRHRGTFKSNSYTINGDQRVEKSEFLKEIEKL